MKHEMQAAPAVDHPSAFWKGMGEVNERILGWSGEGNFKRTLNQNYFNFIPTAPDEPRMVRLRRLVPDFTQNTLDRYAIEDPDRDPSSWMSFYPSYYIFKDPDGGRKRELYREYLALMYEYALRRDRSGLLAALDEPTLGNPIGVRRSGRLISQDLVNSVRERNTIIGAMEANADTHFTLGELGAGYGRLGYVLLKTTKCRYFVFDIPPALYVSQWYLTNLFPGRRAFRFRPFDTFKEIESELSQSDLAFFTPNQLTKFPAGYFDLFANISSIHEMRRDQIKHYMELMGRATKSALYLKQQKDYVNPVDNLVIGRNDYPVPSGWAPSAGAFRSDQSGLFRTDLSAGPPDGRWKSGHWQRQINFYPVAANGSSGEPGVRASELLILRGGEAAVPRDGRPPIGFRGPPCLRRRIGPEAALSWSPQQDLESGRYELDFFSVSDSALGRLTP